MQFKAYHANGISINIPSSFKVDIFQKQSSYYIKNKGRSPIGFLFQIGVPQEAFEAVTSTLESLRNYIDQGTEVSIEINEPLALPKIGRYTKTTFKQLATNKINYNWHVVMIYGGVNIYMRFLANKDYSNLVDEIIALVSIVA